MVRFFFFIISGLLLSETVWAAAADYDRYFKVDMKMEVPDINTYIKKLDTMDQFYDKGMNPGSKWDANSNRSSAGQSVFTV